jgi:hypothetical protein
VRNKEVLHRDHGDRNILLTIRRMQVNWIFHILHRNCLQKTTINGEEAVRIEVTRKQGRRRNQLLGGLKQTRGY